ncbi:hypothetical protein BT67DRAFT_278734 [Trichocladium antarcticum]|uniref:Uncharacterized protein n=1 Tax=Trichocladium antarcticum TaxID=1450529 RepID=A0AAN6UML3_9PEZI|nr:hypothetical protein BT67DRAFT_278734 [Trichocladium antarcticum]
MQFGVQRTFLTSSSPRAVAKTTGRVGTYSFWNRLEGASSRTNNGDPGVRSSGDVDQPVNWHSRLNEDITLWARLRDGMKTLFPGPGFSSAPFTGWHTTQYKRLMQSRYFSRMSPTSLPSILSEYCIAALGGVRGANTTSPLETLLRNCPSLNKTGKYFPMEASSTTPPSSLSSCHVEIACSHSFQVILAQNIIGYSTGNYMKYQLMQVPHSANSCSSSWSSQLRRHRWFYDDGEGLRQRSLIDTCMASRGGKRGTLPDASPSPEASQKISMVS